MNLSVIILAAGRGERMKSNLPKVLHNVAGKPMVSRVIDAACALKPKRIVIVVGYKADIVKDFVVNLHPDIEITFVEQKELLGTGDAVKQALPFVLDCDLSLILTADIPLIQTSSLESLLEVSSPNSLGLLTQVVPDPFGLGRILRDAKNNIVGIVEEKDADENTKKILEINTGVMAIPVGFLESELPKLKTNNAKKEYYLTDLISIAGLQGINIKSSNPLSFTEAFGVNSKSQLALAERNYQKKLALNFMEQGVTLIDPDRFDVRGNLSCGKDVAVDVNCVFEGEVSIGDNVSIGANCYIKDSKIASNTKILANSYIEEALVGENVSIGPYARLRPETVIDEGAKVGNFVELKKTHLGKNSKVNHLSYAGDSVIGQNVNIGAGTITCNYDGKIKNQTIIEDNVFVGSSCQLVAPVTLKEGAIVGAGTTVLKDAPKNKVTLNKKEQYFIDSKK